MQCYHFTHRVTDFMLTDLVASLFRSTFSKPTSVYPCSGKPSGILLVLLPHGLVSSVAGTIRFLN